MDNIFNILVNNYTFLRVNNELIPDISIIYLAVTWHVFGAICTMMLLTNGWIYFRLSCAGLHPPWPTPHPLVTGGEGGSAETREFDTQHDFAKPPQQQQLQKTASQLPPTAERGLMLL